MVGGKSGLIFNRDLFPLSKEFVKENSIISKVEPRTQRNDDRRFRSVQGRLVIENIPHAVIIFSIKIHPLVYLSPHDQELCDRLATRPSNAAIDRLQISGARLDTRASSPPLCRR